MTTKRVLILVAGAVLGAGPTLRAGGVERRHLDLPGRTGKAPYSDAVRAGDTLYLSGRLGLDPETGRPPADPAEQVRLVLDGMRAVLARAGMSMDDLVAVQVFCTDVALLETFNAVYRTHFTKGYPARAFIGSGPLLFGARFEVQGIAVRRRARR